MIACKIKVLSVIGTRPEAIKMAPVIQALRRYPERIHSQVLVTAQHRDMADQALQVFDLKPDYDLDVMTGNQTPNQVAAAVFARLDGVLQAEKPDWLLVQGDTTTVMAAGMAAFYRRIRVGHVEAGLRTGDKWNPFPEEMNRRVAGLVADLHFAPTATARANLLAEGVPPAQILVTGNPVIDALRWVAGLPTEPGLVADLLPEDPSIRVILLTAHRRENFGQGVRNICEAVRKLCARYDDTVWFVYPVHPNPNVAGPVESLLGDLKQVKRVPPLDYHSLVQVMARSYLVLTDSGGIQEEAPGLGKPVLVLRAVTERPEAVAAGTVRLVGTDPEAIVNAFRNLWEDEAAYRRMAQAVNPYGDGRAAGRIVKALLGEQVEEFAYASSKSE